LEGASHQLWQRKRRNTGLSRHGCIEEGVIQEAGEGLGIRVRRRLKVRPSVEGPLLEKGQIMSLT
jgi:hypothetical protein